MKKFFGMFLLLALIVISCAPRTTGQGALKPQQNEEGQWELIVIDTDFDYYLNAIAKPASFYSEATLKQRNTMLVSEWNSYYYAGRHRNIIESGIEYNPNENYGKDFEYKLYQVFAYVQWKYGLRLRGLSAADAF